MRNVTLVTKHESSTVRRTYFVVIDRISAIEIPTGDTFKMHYDNEVWIVPTEEYNRIMHVWAPYYRELEEYKNYIERN